MFRRFISEQLNHPTGIIGRCLLPFIWNRRNRALNDITLSRLQPQQEDRILDVGFGGGYLIGRLLNIVTNGRICGVDASKSILEHGRTRFARAINAGTLDIQCCGVDSLPYPDRSFSKVCSVNSLFYWPDVHRGVCEIYRVLSPGGLVLLTFTSKEDLDKRGFSPELVHSFADKEVIDLLLDAGFSDVRLEQGKDNNRRFGVVTGRK